MLGRPHKTSVSGTRQDRPGWRKAHFETAPLRRCKPIKHLGTAVPGRSSGDGIIFALFKGRLSKWWAIPYGLAVGIGFLVSPVVQALGVGLFGKDFGWHFAATVLTAHAAFGIALAGLVELRIRLAPFPTAVRNALP